MSLLLALAAALVLGLGDFCGGTAARRSRTLAVLLVSVPTGLVFLLVLALPGAGATSAGAWAWGATGGVAGALGLVLFYRGLATGKMSVVAPLTAVTSAAVPVVAGVVLGERPGPLAYVGVVLAVGAVALVSRGEDQPVDTDPDNPPPRTVLAGILLALLAGVCFGFYFVFVRVAPADTGLWPLVAARTSSTVCTVLLAAAARQLELPGRSLVGGSALALAVASGLSDAGANALYLHAARGGMLTLVAVVVSLYPGSTVLLARIVHSERLARPQAVGLGLAGVAVALLALPS